MHRRKFSFLPEVTQPFRPLHEVEIVLSYNKA